MPDRSEIAQNLDLFLRRLHTSLHARKRAAGVDHVHRQSAMVLLTLAEHQPMAMQDLAERLARDKSQITRMARDLEGKGLVGKSQHPGDARVSLLQLTHAGTELVSRLQGLMNEVLCEILAPLNADESQTLSRILNKL